ncbi:uncharacterized protein N7529_004533 [Penicillium soppii]|jgi:hypothetical protein|uniref:uncharacterized protein n=1 Tax=Penicillium soppii TaxID=69789 RepID=UPI0025484F93|nr:uncharacterized protein N7529_004533 [Penicillium soppii]KAJ5872180.1 hypothetical protein N7529_004533 [Penicillium soppii]
MKRTCVLLASWATTTAAVASGAVTCTTTAAQLVTNPSFEDGTTGWTIQTGSSYDTFVYSLAPDGRSVLALNGDLNNVLSQPISNMVVGETYTVSWYWQLLAVATGQCELSVTIGSQTVNTAISTSTSNQAAWLPGTGAYTATASSALLELSLACTSGSFSSYSEVNFDDITVTGPNTETCSTAAVTPISTPTLTPTPSSSVASSSALAILTKSSSAAVNIVSLSVATGSSASILPSSAISSACIQYAIQVVQNPSFESGLTDWTFNVEPATIEAVEGNAEDGIYVL